MATQSNSTSRTPAITAEALGNNLTLTFSNGYVLTLDAHNVLPSIRDQAMMHGFKQKLVDAAAMSCNPETGRPATIDDKYNAVREVYDRLTDTVAPSWNKIREGAGSSGGGLLFRALCELYPAKTPDALREFIKSKSAGEQAALRATAKIAAIIDRIKSEQVKTDGIDGDELLAGLE